ncbi:MAG: sugar phosphate isomerase/epimerase [Lentisphaeria bacterium]|nr:sugar phosphate isomerase/epimerase [Lentisphaeria bacterium]
MKPLLTHAYPWHKGDSDTQKKWMRAFADAGEKHIVMSSKLFGEACKDPDYLINFHKAMQEFGLDFVDAHAFWGTWSDPGMPLPEWHEQLILRHRISIRLCAQYGVDTLAFHTGNTLNSVFGKDLNLGDYRSVLIHSIEELLPDAEKYGVLLALENQWMPLNHSRILLEIMEYFHSPNLGLCYDSGHGNLMEKGMLFPGKTSVPPTWEELGEPVEWEEKLIEKFVPWMVNCHLHDNNGILDEHQLPGHGTVDWTRIKNALQKAPRLRNIQNESFPHEYTITETCQVYRKITEGLCL